MSRFLRQFSFRTFHDKQFRKLSTLIYNTYSHTPRNPNSIISRVYERERRREEFSRKFYEPRVSFSHVYTRGGAGENFNYRNFYVLHE